MLASKKKQIFFLKSLCRFDIVSLLSLIEPTSELSSKVLNYQLNFLKILGYSNFPFFFLVSVFVIYNFQRICPFKLYIYWHRPFILFHYFPFSVYRICSHVLALIPDIDHLSSFFLISHLSTLLIFSKRTALVLFSLMFSGIIFHWFLLSLFFSFGLIHCSFSSYLRWKLIWLI